jgi:hypothetical protein
MSKWKDRFSYVKEGLFAAFLGSIAILTLTQSHALNGEHMGRRGDLIKILWGWPLGLLCGGLALYSLAKIYKMATGSSASLKG